MNRKSNHSENINTEKVIAEIEQNPELGTILRSAAPFGLTSAKMAMALTSFSKKIVDNCLGKLSQFPNEVFQPHSMIAIEKNGRPEKAYLLTQTGIDICRSLWPDLPAIQLNPRDDLALAHRYSQALVSLAIQDEGLQAEIEQVLPYGHNQNMRADLLVKLPGNHKRILEIEQQIGRNNLPRALQKFLGYRELFQDNPDPGLSSEVLFIFNLKETDLKKTLPTWQDALGKALAQKEGAMFSARYTTLQEFLVSPNANDLSCFRILEPKEPKNSNPLMSETDSQFPLFSPGATPPLKRMQSILGLMVAEYNQQAESIFNEQDESQRFLNLCDLALMIYDASFGEDGPTRKYAAFPTASLFHLRNYLHMPQNAALFAELEDGVKWINDRQTGLVMYRDAVTRLVWDIFLRYMGLGRRGPLEVWVRVPGMEDRASDLQIDLRILNTDFMYMSFGMEQKYVEALSFMLTAIVFYKLKSAQFIIEKVPTLKKPTLKLLSKRGPLYYRKGAHFCHAQRVGDKIWIA